MGGVHFLRMGGAQAESIGGGSGLGEVAARENELDFRVLHQRFADAAAEESICTQNQDSLYGLRHEPKITCWSGRMGG